MQYRTAKHFSNIVLLVYKVSTQISIFLIFIVGAHWNCLSEANKENKESIYLSAHNRCFH